MNSEIICDLPYMNIGSYADFNFVIAVRRFGADDCTIHA